MEWQTFETAPNDGREFIARSSRTGALIHDIVHYEPYDNTFQAGPFDYSTHDCEWTDLPTTNIYPYLIKHDKPPDI